MEDFFIVIFFSFFHSNFCNAILIKKETKHKMESTEKKETVDDQTIEIEEEMSAEAEVIKQPDFVDYDVSLTEKFVSVPKVSERMKSDWNRKPYSGFDIKTGRAI